MVAAAQPIEYPTSDGKPMAETEKHRDLMIYCITTLQAHFETRPEVYVSGNNFLYWEEGDIRKVVSPDCYVVFGVGKQQRDLYKVWEEGVLPSVVFEFTSKKTRRQDTDRKRPLYEQVLQVAEYFLFDPTSDYLKPNNLQGYRLNAEGKYEALILNDNTLYSEQLDLELVAEGEVMRFRDPRTGQLLLTPLEQKHRAEAAEAHLRALAQRFEFERQRANAAVQRAESERQRADLEATRRAEAEAEAARLRAELEAFKRQQAETTE